MLNSLDVLKYEQILLTLFYHYKDEWLGKRFTRPFLDVKDLWTCRGMQRVTFQMTPKHHMP